METKSRGSSDVRLIGKTARYFANVNGKRMLKEFFHLSLGSQWRASKNKTLIYLFSTMNSPPNFSAAKINLNSILSTFLKTSPRNPKKAWISIKTAIRFLSMEMRKKYLIKKNAFWKKLRLEKKIMKKMIIMLKIREEEIQEEQSTI